MRRQTKLQRDGWFGRALADDGGRIIPNLANAMIALRATLKFISRSDPVAQWTGAHKVHAFVAYANIYLIDTDHGVIFDVEAKRAIRQAHRR